MPSAVAGMQWPALSPTKNTSSSVARRSLWGIQLPWKPSGGSPRSCASSTVGSRTCSRGSNEPTPTRTSSRAGKAQE